MKMAPPPVQLSIFDKKVKFSDHIISLQEIQNEEGNLNGTQACGQQDPERRKLRLSIPVVAG